MHYPSLRSSFLRPVWGGMLLLGVFGASGCGGRVEAPSSPAPPPLSSPGSEEGQRFAQAGLFVEAGPETGLAFSHFNGMSGELYFHEMMGAGAALIDYDGDGDLDVYLVQGHMLGQGKTMADALFPSAEGPPFRDRLFRNELTFTAEDGAPVLRFTDVTEASGIDAQGYGMGVAAGDIDNDGWPDLYVTNFRGNQLWRNRGDGTFEDITETAGVGDRGWSVPAVFWDYDRDGWLDLFVGNYLDFSVATHKRCTTELGTPNYCGPLAFGPQEDALYRNQGDGTFENVTGRAGMRGAEGGALGAMTADLNGDGWLDLYVANDGVPNALWMNQGDGTFRNEALLAGAAVNRDGQPEASMGIDVADVDGDGDEDLFMTHLRRETNTLYVNAGDGTFEDFSAPSGLGAPSLDATGFGTVFLDFDNDGLPDLIVVNGAVKVIEEQALAGDPFPLHEKNRLYRGLGDGGFEDVTDAAGGAFLRSGVSRGAVVGDIDNDGDADVLLTQNAGPARLLLNRHTEEEGAGGWIGLRLLESNGRDALGAWVRLDLKGSPPAWRRVRTAGSYASSNDPRVLFGLGEAQAGAADIVVVWADDRGPRSERFIDVETGRYSSLRRGEGSAEGRP